MSTTFEGCPVTQTQTPGQPLLGEVSTEANCCTERKPTVLHPPNSDHTPLARGMYLTPPTENETTNVVVYAATVAPMSASWTYVYMRPFG